MKRLLLAGAGAMLLVGLADVQPVSAQGRESRRLITPRIAPLEAAQWTDAHRALVATYDRGKPVTNDFKTLLVHPDLVAGVMPFLRYVSSESTLPPRHRDLLILRTSWLCRAEYVWAHHAAAAGAHGVSRDEIERVARGPDVPGWDPFEATLLRAADELYVDSFISEPTWQALAARYDRHQLMDAVFAVAEFTMVSMTLNSVGVQLDAQVTERLPIEIPYQVSARRSDERLAAARIAPLDPADWTAAVRAMLDPTNSGRNVAAVYRTFAQHEKLYPPRQRLSEYIRLQSTLSARVREMLILRIGWLCRAEYEWSAHAGGGRRAGLSDAEIEQLAVGPDAPGWDAFDRALLRAVDEMYQDGVISDRTWDALASRFDAKQLLDVLITTGGYRMVSMALNTFGVQREPGSEGFPQISSR